MSMAEAAPSEDCLVDCIQVCAQPERNAADTAVLPANFRKSRLEMADNSLPMEPSSYRVLERLLPKIKPCQFQRLSTFASPKLDLFAHSIPSMIASVASWLI